MKAIGLTEFGGPEVLRPIELPDPRAGVGQVRVRVHAAAVNPVDVMFRDGSIAPALSDLGPPFVPGMDLAGTVDEVGPGVDGGHGIRVGQDVVGIAGDFGAYGEYIVLPVESVAPKPTGASFPMAASFLMNALTARAMLDLLAVPPGGTLLVTGAAGALGGYAVQLAAAESVRVIAVASPQDFDLVRKFGAAEVVARGDHVTERVLRLVPGGVDAVADGALLREEIVPAVRAGGAFSAVRAWDGTPGRNIRILRVSARACATEAATIRALCGEAEAGRLAMRVAKVLPADAASAAHEMVERGGRRGRIVLEF